MLALLQNVGDLFAANGFKAERILEGSGDLAWSVDFAQGHDFLNVMRGVEPFFLEFPAIEFGLRTEAQESQKQSLVTGLLALGQEFLGVIGIGHVPAAVIRADMSGDEFFVVEKEELVGIDFEGQLL